LFSLKVTQTIFHISFDIFHCSFGFRGPMITSKAHPSPANGKWQMANAKWQMKNDK